MILRDKPRRSDSIAKVIDKGFCIGCGICTAIDPSFRIGETRTGTLEIVERTSNPEILDLASRVCPFADAPDETAIAADQFSSAPYFHPALGRYEAIYAGYAEEFRRSAGSGGITRWLLSRSLDLGKIDFVVVVDRKLAGEDGDLFRVALHETSSEYLEHTSTSAYFPTSFDQVLNEINQRKGRFAITALPCFARALRAYALINTSFGERLAFVSGTICGALKSRRYAEYLAWQMGVGIDELDRINFRGKSLSRSANEKCVEVWSDDNTGEHPSQVERVQNLAGTDYGSGYFKPKACDYCDDVFAETADVSFGDAWISPYKERPQGTNVIVVRSKFIADLLHEGREEGGLILDPISADDAQLTQNSGLRHRRQGLAVRLAIARVGWFWTPRKRVRPALAGLGFFVSQVIRILIRRCSQARMLKPESKTFHRVMWRLTALHRKVRPYAVRDQSPTLGQLRTGIHIVEESS